LEQSCASASTGEWGAKLLGYGEATVSVWRIPLAVLSVPCSSSLFSPRRDQRDRLLSIAGEVIEKAAVLLHCTLVGIGTKRTFRGWVPMSVIGGKADIGRNGLNDVNDPKRTLAI
jgi:hypothetical protein